MTSSSPHRRSRHPFTVEDYHRMAESGVLGPDDRVELLEGEIVEMTPIGSKHAGMVNRLNRLLQRAVGDTALVSIQNPLRLSEFSEPEPDICLLEPREDDYAGRHPTPRDTHLVIEVAETSAEDDRERKLPIYATHGVPRVWLVDLTERRVDVYADPTDDEFQSHHRIDPGDTLLIRRTDKELSWSDLFENHERD